MKAGDQIGIGYSYADIAAATLIQDRLSALLMAQYAIAINARWHDMAAAIRKLGRPGISLTAVSAIDTAL
jgi:L-alanine-DL-glutamate epimerase-like enolase superfamily enzyme